MIKNKVEQLNNPYGQVTYETFRARRQAFVDKTGIIESLDDEGMTPYPVLLRPRRFGKSTFIQMLKCFYDISYKDRYDKIFSGKKIYAVNLADHNTYHVINFDFSRINTQSSSTFSLLWRTELITSKYDIPILVLIIRTLINPTQLHCLITLHPLIQSMPAVILTRSDMITAASADFM